MNYNIKKIQENAWLRHATCEHQGRQRSLCLPLPGCPPVPPSPPCTGGTGPAQGMAGAAQCPSTAAMAPRHRRGGLGPLPYSSGDRPGVSLVSS